MDSNVEKYVQIMDSLGVKQMVLQGPPGTSKTYSAKEIIRAYLTNPLEEEIIKKDSKGKWSGHWDMVQFHPSYGYEDFVRGITVTTEDKQIIYKTINKVFGKMCEAASANKNEKFFLLIDEINRADIATVFGELIYALEYRDESVEVPYELEDGDNRSKISVPDNLYIIATMNTADKSVGNIDYAIRRRFLFFDLLPDENVIRNDRKRNDGIERNVDIVINTFRGINKFIEDATKDSQYRANDFKIGHAYFLDCGEFNLKDLEALEYNNSQNSSKFCYRMQYQVLPILREYYIDGIIKIYNQNKYTALKEYLNGEDLYNKLLKDIISGFIE